GAIRNKWVGKMFGGKLSQEAGTYTQLAADLEAQGDRGEVAAAVHAFMLPGRKAPPGFDAATIAQVGTLLGVQESHRSKASLVTSPMVLQLIQRGMPWQDAFKLFPMAPLGAAASADVLERHLERWKKGQSTGKTPFMFPGGRVDQMMQAEVKLIQAWIVAMDLKFADKSDEEAKKKHLKDEIRSRILKFWRLQSPGEGSQ